MLFQNLKENPSLEILREPPLSDQNVFKLMLGWAKRNLDFHLWFYSRAIGPVGKQQDCCIQNEKTCLQLFIFKEGQNQFLHVLNMLRITGDSE